MNFTIPKTTPPGKYLMRVEHLYPRADYNSSQFFISCTHLDIKGPGGGTPGPMVKFPGAYDNWDPGVTFSSFYFLIAITDFIALSYMATIRILCEQESHKIHPSWSSGMARLNGLESW